MVGESNQRVVNQNLNDNIRAVTSTLWTDASKSRCFLIPDNINLLPGSFVLETMTDHKFHVDARIIAEFEIAKEQANKFLKFQLRDTLGKLSKNLRNVLPTGEVQTSATPGLDLIAALTQIPRKNLTCDYASIGKALRTHLSDLANAAKDAVGGDPERMAAARERMENWGKILREHGIEVPHPENQETPTEPAQEHAEPEGTPSVDEPSFSERLKGLAEEFRRRADALEAARQTTKPSGENGNGKN